MASKAKPTLSLNLNLNLNLNVSPSLTTSLIGSKNILTRRRRPIKSLLASYPHRLSRFLSSDSSTQLNLVRNRELSTLKRRRFNPHVLSSLAELPLLPFPIDQILVPSECRTLHLFEARYLALLEEVERLDVGALVSIRGVGRVTLVKFVQADHYLKGLVVPLQDNVPEHVSEISSKAMELKEALYSLNSLEIKLKAPKEVLLQTQIADALMWAKKGPSLDCDEAFIPSFAERLCFAALQPISGSTQSELLALRKEKLRAMDVKDTLERLDSSTEFVKKNISMVAAKLAIQSLGNEQ
ncbi:uncharacterized protein LOC132273878 isoform X2 [Cornus florida]|uniref:uncharacterized protein LOC132273878 isoform X2 n=1 Tax=Cornus florida TaxID=4283 RepID=UPI0028A00A04|nr:uncharacterized protein LOC132273878 isoform X2 [Cornus florida]